MSETSQAGERFAVTVERTGVVNDWGLEKWNLLVGDVIFDIKWLGPDIGPGYAFAEFVDSMVAAR